MNGRDRLALLLGPELLDALDSYVAERVAVALAATPTVEDGARWLTCEQAAKRLGCSAPAIRMRVKRGRLEHRRQGRRLYVSARSVNELDHHGLPV